MRWLAGALKSLAILLVAGLAVFGTATAGNTLVTAVVCSSATGSVITLSSPVTDSTVNQADITVAGHVVQAETLNVSVDGVQQATVPLSSLNQDFSVIVPVSEGTHTITLAARDVCHISDGHATAVVTYARGSQPSEGANVPTDLPSQAPITSPPVPPTVGNLPFLRELPHPETLPTKVVDAAQPPKTILSPTSVIIGIPFIVGAGAFGWIHIRRLMH